MVKSVCVGRDLKAESVTRARKKRVISALMTSVGLNGSASGLILLSQCLFCEMNKGKDSLK